MIVAGFSAIHRKEASAKVKSAVMYRPRKQYPVLVMCLFFAVSKSGYFNFVKRISHPKKDAALAETIRQQ